MIELDKLPEELRERVKEDIQNHGDWAYVGSDYSQMAPFGRMLQELKPSDTDYVWFIVTLHLINLFGSKDPSSVHFTTAREFLKRIDIEKDPAVDLLARALVFECKNFREFIFKRFSFDELSHFMDLKNEQKLTDTSGLTVPERTERPEFICSEGSCNAIDLSFAEFLEKLGKNGQESAVIIKESAPNRYLKYKESNYGEANRQEAWSVWVPKEASSPFSPFLNILVAIVWNDKCKHIWEKEKKNVPAITQGVLIKTLKPPLSKDSRVEVIENSITCYSEEGEIIARVPCVDTKLVNLISAGMESFSSLNGHKLIRWQVRTGFNNWAKGVEDPRLICTSGGYEGIANLIGCGNSKKSPTEIKAILHAQAYGQFAFPQGGAGNMIILREIDKHRNGEPSKINLILGEMLLPNFTHQLPQGEKRRLIPITDLPPLIGSKNTHAAQAMLQLLILEEFSKQSDRLASRKCVLIPEDKWLELSSQAKLPKSSLSKVIAGWTEDDLFSKAFLQKQGDEFTLGTDYVQVLDFLEYQGQQRIHGAIGGRKSAEVKKRIVKSNYTRKK